MHVPVGPAGQVVVAVHGAYALRGSYGGAAWHEWPGLRRTVTLAEQGLVLASYSIAAQMRGVYVAW